MKIAESWLREWVNPDLDTEALAHRLTMAGHEVDDIALEGDLSEDQRQRMLEIADRCPVHRTLENEIRIRSRLL